MKKYSGQSLKKQLKIALVSHEVNVKSGSRAPIELAKALAKENTVSFFAYPYNLDKKTATDLKASDVELFILPSKERNAGGKIKNMLALNKELRTHPPDLISSHCLFPLFFALLFVKRPIISTYYGLQQNIVGEKLFPENLNISQKILDLLFNLLSFIQQLIIIRLSHHSVAISRYSQNEIQRLYKKKVPHIYLGAISSSLENG